MMNRNFNEQSDDEIDYKGNDQDSHLGEEESEDESFIADQNESDDDDDDFEDEDD